MKTSKALRLTKKNLWNGKRYNGGFGNREFICHAAVDAGVGDIVKPIVHSLLDHKASLGTWLEDNGVNCPWNDMPKLQATRKAWLDHLIAHYEARGD